MKSDNNKNINENVFEKQLEEIEEFQRHANDPGHWLGGKMSHGQKNLFNTPAYTIPFGVIMLIFGVATFLHEVGDKIGAFQIALFSVVWIAFIIISALITIRGFKNVIRKRRDKL